MHGNGLRVVVALALAGAVGVTPVRAEPPPVTPPPATPPPLEPASMKDADDLERVGLTHLEAGRHREAADAFQQVLALRRRSLPADHPTVASASQNLGVALMKAGDLRGAIAAFEDTLRADQKHLGPDDPGVMTLLRTLGRLTHQLGDYDGARGWLERQLKLYGALAPEQREGLARTLTHYGIVLSALGLLVEAEAALNEAAGSPGGDEPPLSFRIARARGDVLLQAGRLAEAQFAFLAALDEADTAGIEQALSRLGLGETYTGLGLYGEAQDQLSKALSGISKAAGRESAEAGAALRALAHLYEHLGDPIAAGRHYAASAAAYGRALGARHPQVGVVVAEYGLLLAGQEDMDAAAAHLELGGGIIRDQLGADHPGLAVVERGLGDLARQRGELANAERHYQAALSLAERRLPAHHPTVVGVRTALALAKAGQGTPAAALQELDGVLLVVTAAFGPTHVSVAELLGHRALVNLQMERRDDAWDDLARAGAIRSAVRDVVGRGPFAEVTRARFATLDRVVDDTLLDLAITRLGTAPDGPRQLIDLVLERKGARLQSQLPRPRLPKTAEAQALQEVSTRLAMAWLGQAPASAEEVTRLLAERQRLEATVGDAVLRARAGARDLHIQELCAALPRGAVLVDYTRLWRPRIQTALDIQWSQVLVAVVVQAEGCKVTAHDLGPWDPIADRLIAHRQAVARSREQGNQAADAEARHLYDALVAPWAGLAKGAPLVLVSPEAELALLPFAALRGPDGEYLLDTLPVVMLDRPRDLARLGAKAPVGRGVLLLADPDFQRPGTASGPPASRRRGATCAELDKARWEALPATRAMAERAATLWTTAGEPVDTLLGDAATEAALAARVAGRRVVDLATHGFGASEACHQPGAAARNPLLFSGLVLAGAGGTGQGGDDGWLTSVEAAALKLEGVELVITSAAGLAAPASGEGVAGFRRALMHAGARGVVLPLWPVDTETTAAMMGRLHERLTWCGAGRCAKWEALRSAQAAMRDALEARDGVAPVADWAAFVYTGEWER